MSTEPDEADADAEEGRDDAAVPRGAWTDIEDAPSSRRAKPRKKPALPAEDPTDPRPIAEYVNAHDDVAHEIGAVGSAGATAIRGAEIAEAMQRRGFPNRKRVLAVTRAHLNWIAVAEMRSEFWYSATRVARENHGATVLAIAPGERQADRRDSGSVEVARAAPEDATATGGDDRA